MAKANLLRIARLMNRRFGSAPSFRGRRVVGRGIPKSPILRFYSSETEATAMDASYTGLSNDAKGMGTDLIHNGLLWMGERIPPLSASCGLWVTNLYRTRAKLAEGTTGKVVVVKEYDQVTGSLEIAKMISIPVNAFLMWLWKKLWKYLFTVLWLD